MGGETVKGQRLRKSEFCEMNYDLQRNRMAQKKIVKMEEERQESEMKISSEARTTLFVPNHPIFFNL